MIVGGVRKFMVKASFGIPRLFFRLLAKVTRENPHGNGQDRRHKRGSDELSQGGLDAPTNNVMTDDLSREE